MIYQNTFDNTLPQKGDLINYYGTSTDESISTVLADPKPYTGRYTQHFTHVIKISTTRTNRGWIEILFKLEHSQ